MVWGEAKQEEGFWGKSAKGTGKDGAGTLGRKNESRAMVLGGNKVFNLRAAVRTNGDPCGAW